MRSFSKKTINDIILVLAILILALASFLIFKACAKEGSVVSITVDGKLYKTLSLDTDVVVEVVTGENGEYKNTVTVKDGKVSITYANCPDGICEDHRAIKHRGETIVCLPHRLVVTVEGDSNEAPDVDLSVK